MKLLNVFKNSSLTYFKKYKESCIIVQLVLAFYIYILVLYFDFKLRITFWYIFFIFGFLAYLISLGLICFIFFVFKIRFFNNNYKKAIVNRKYLHIKDFWKTNFRKSYAKIPIYNLIWQFPLLIIISFYTGLSSRYKILSFLYYGLLAINYIFNYNNISFVFFIGFLIPLFFVTVFTKFSLIKNNLKSTYGQNTLYKLNF